MTRTPLVQGPPNQCSAPGAGLAVAAIGAQRPGEVAAATVDVDIQGIEAGATGLQGPFHHDSGLSQDRQRLALTEGEARSVETGAGGPQGLVGVDVADPADQVLRQQQSLDGSAAGAQPTGDGGQVRGGIEDVTGDLRGVAGDQLIGAAQARGCAVLAGDQLAGPEPAEQSLVDQVDRGAVLEVQGQSAVAQRIRGRALGVRRQDLGGRVGCAPAADRSCPDEPSGPRRSPRRARRPGATTGTSRAAPGRSVAIPAERRAGGPLPRPGGG